MSYDRSPTIDLPKIAGTQLHSSVDIISKMTHFLQHRFSTVDMGQGTWDPDNTKSGILITNYLAEQETEISSPLKISIDRGTITHNRVSIGNMDQNQMNLFTRSHATYYSAGSCILRLECTASTPGAAEVLGYVVFTAIHMTREGLKQQFLWRDISEVAVQPCTPIEVGGAQNRVFRTNVEFIIHFETRWASAHADPVARSVVISKKQPEDIDYIKLIARDGADPSAP